MSEREKFEGWLVIAGRKAKEKKLRIKGLIKSIRDILAPLDPIEDLETEIVAEQAKELNELMGQYKEIQKEVNKVKKDLGQINN